MNPLAGGEQLRPAQENRALRLQPLRQGERSEERSQDIGTKQRLGFDGHADSRINNDQTIKRLVWLDCKRAMQSVPEIRLLPPV
jgi:hypothetical protein